MHGRLRSSLWLALAAVPFLGCVDQPDPLGPDDANLRRTTRGGKVTVCHISPGNGTARLISVGRSALRAHMRHGDTRAVCLMITEVMYDPAATQGPDSRAEYVELHNPSRRSVDLRSSFFDIAANSLKIRDGSTTDPDYFKSLDNTYPLTIPPGGYAVIYDNGSSGSDVPVIFPLPAGTVEATVDDAAIGNGLNNGGDELILLTPDLSTVIDRMRYDGTLADGNGLSLQRCGRRFVEAVPTPGAANAC